MGDETSRLVVQVTNQGINETTSSLAGLANQARATETATKGITQVNQQSGESFGSLALKIAGYSTGLNVAIGIARSAISGMADLGKEAITLAASFERSRVAWGVFMKDVQAGGQMFDDLYSLAQRTPMTFQGVESAAQMLKGFGLAASDIIPTLERMGDVARGNDETMQRLALAYGQALAQGKVLTRDLYQFVNAGVPIFDALSQVMGKSVEQVQALVTDGKVGFPEIEAALKSLTGQGGMFEGMMDKAAETMEGKLSIATDNWKALLADLGDRVIPTLKKALDDFNASADKTLNKTNLQKVVSGVGGNPAAALAFVESELSQMLPGTEGAQRYQYEWAQKEILAIMRDRSALGAMKSDTPQNLITPKVDPWRDVLTSATGFNAREGTWSYKEGRATDYQLPSGLDLITRKLDSDKAGFENIVGSPYEEGFRKEFTSKATALQETLLTSGLWKIGERSIAIIDEYIAKYGYKKPVKDTSIEDLAKEYAGLRGFKGQSGMAPAGDWSSAASIEQQMADLESFWMPGIEADNETQAAKRAAIQLKGKLYGSTWGTQFGLSGDLAAIADQYMRPKSEATNAIPFDRTMAARWQGLGNQTIQGGARWGNAEGRDAELWAAMNAAFGPLSASIMARRNNSPSFFEQERGGYDPSMSLHVGRLASIGVTPYDDKPDVESIIAQLSEPGGAMEEWKKGYFEYLLSVLKEEFKVPQNMAPPPSMAWMSDETPEEMRKRIRIELGVWEPSGDSEMPTYASPLERKQARDAANTARMAAWEAYNQIGTSKYGWTGGRFNGEVPTLPEAWRSAPTENDYSLDTNNLAAMGSKLFKTITTQDRWEYPQKPTLPSAYGLGTIDLNNRPMLRNADGSISTVRSTSFSFGDEEVLIPTVGPNGEDWSPQEALAYYIANPDQFLGKFGSIEEADAYAQQLHLDQEKLYAPYADKKFIKGNTEKQPYNDFFGAGEWRKTNAMGDVSRPYQTAVTDAEKLTEAQDALAESVASGELSYEGYTQRLRELREQYDPATKAAKLFGDAILSTAVNTLSSELFTLGEALVSGADGWSSFGNAMGNTFEAIIKMLPKLAIQAGLGMLGNLNQADDTLGLALIGGGLIGSVGAGMLGNANGGVYNSPSLSRYSNGVYDKPQLFTFSRGGVFGEAGPEAIMPLSRDSAGRLGVKAQSGGEIAVQIINQTPTQVTGKAQTVTDAAGNRKLVLTIREIARQEVATAGAGGRRLS